VNPNRFFVVILAFIYFLSPLRTIAQTESQDEEISIDLNIQGIGNVETPALIRGQAVYLSVSDIFDFLKIVNHPSATRDSISGFFIDQHAAYLIDKSNNSIQYKKNVYRLKPRSIIKTSTNFYLSADYFGKIFELNCVFSFRNLAVKLSTALELPVMREMRQKEMRNNINKLKGNIKVDTTIGRSFSGFHFGMADWSVISTQQDNHQTGSKVYLGLGGVIAGGETDVGLNYQNSQPLQERNQYYSWRLVDNDNSVLRQIVAGKIFGQATSTIASPIVGLQITNAPTSYRRSFGTYRISNITQPNWIVELYVNNVLVNYTRADASGNYTFAVPLLYGTTIIKLRFYGPSGEEISSEQNVMVPFNFLPKNEFEYTAGAGIVEDGSMSRFSRVSGYYGLTSGLTVGGGTEYLSSVKSGNTMPFIGSSARLWNNLLISGEYAYGVRTKSVLSYSFNSGIQIELNDTWYKQGQTAINNNFSQERKAILSMPLRNNFFSAYTRFTFDQIFLPQFQYTTVDWLISAATGHMNANIETYGVYLSKNEPGVNSKISITATGYRGFLLTEQVQFDYRTKKLMDIKEQVEHRFSQKGFLTLSYETNIFSHLNSIELGLRYDFTWGQTAVSARKSNAVTSYIQSANGSLVSDAAAKYLKFDNHTNVGRGGVTVIPFLDLNLNGKMDPGEPKVAGLKLHINGGQVEQNTRDTLIRVTNLEPYINYTLELDPANFGNIAWQIKKCNISVAIDPNKIKEIDVPVSVVGEIAGKVVLNSNAGQQELSGIMLRFYNRKSHKMIAQTLTEPDGYFDYLGLPPGDYSAKVDAEQLQKLHLECVADGIDFQIKKSLEGTVVDGLEFILKEKK
jgi:hypothetical protein